MIEAMIARYGLLAVFAGTFFEGETVLLLAGFAAHRGYLDLSGVIVAALLGTLLGDQAWFWVGRTRGRRFLDAHPLWANRVDGTRVWIIRHQRMVIWSFRFLYGIRSVTPFVLGMGGIPPVRFALLNAGSAAVWAVLVGGAGYLLGSGLERLLGDLHHVDRAVFAAIVLVGFGVWISHVRRIRRAAAGSRGRGSATSDADSTGS